MKKIITAFAILLVSCSPEPNKESVQFPYEYVNSQYENEGFNRNKMELYSFSGEINIDTLKIFCKQQKDGYTSGMFYFLVLFDTKENAVFPIYPFTSTYSLEEEPLKHIRAYYTYNRLNGYSTLEYYEKNMWESKPKSIDLK